MVGVGGAGGAVGALAVRLGDMAVLTDRTGTLVVVKTLFQAFGELKPILSVVKLQGWLGNHRDEDDSDSFMVQQHHNQQDEDESTHHTQHCAPHRH